MKQRTHRQKLNPYYRSGNVFERDEEYYWQHQNFTK